MDIRFPYGLCGDCAENLHWVTDRFCLLCGKPLPEPENRGKGKKETESLCTDCRQDGRAFDRGVTCVWYGLLERELMQRFKYGGQAWYGEKMGQLMAEKLQREGLRADLVLPVPMYPRIFPIGSISTLLNPTFSISSLILMICPFSPQLSPGMRTRSRRNLVISSL